MKNNHLTLPPRLPEIAKPEKTVTLTLMNGDTMDRDIDGLGRLRKIQTRRNGIKHGPHFEYFADGIHLSVEKHFSAGQLEGPLTQYRKTGGLMTRRYFSNDVLDGTTTEFHQDGRTRRTETPYTWGKKDGIVRQYDTLGQIAATETWQNGIQTGDTDTYYPSGRAASTTVMEDGLKHQKTCFYESGFLKSVEKFNDGIPVGTAYHLHPNGVVANRVTFTNGEIKTEDGLHPNGQRAFHRAHTGAQVYGRNRPSGLQLAWSENGTLTERVMANGLDNTKDLLAAQREVNAALVLEGDIVATAPPVFTPQ